MMRILNVVHQYTPATGGAERYTADLSEALVRKGHEVTVYTSRSTDYRQWDNTLPDHEKRNGVNIRRFNSFRRGALTWRILDKGVEGYFRTKQHRFEPMILWGNGPVMPALYTTMLREAKSFDVVHVVNLHYAQALVAVKAAQRCGVPVVNSPLVHIEQPLTHKVRYMRNMIRDADGIIALTRAEGEYLRSQYPDQRITVAGVGVDLDQFPSLPRHQARDVFDLPKDAFVVLFLGRKTQYKHLDLVYKAFARLVLEDDTVWLLSVGPETELSKELRTQYEYLPNVINVDRVSDEQRLAALASANVLVLPSEGESFGIVYLEAWAYHIPVIGANVAAVASLIDDDVNGKLCESGNADSVYNEMRWMHLHPELAQAMGEAGFNKLRARYQVSRVADIIEGAFIRAIRHHKTKAALKNGA